MRRNARGSIVPAMAHPNPLRAPLPSKSERLFDRWLYSAYPDGTARLSSRLRVVVGPSFLHFTPDTGLGPPTSIPLGWIQAIVHIGHGVRVNWDNPITRTHEATYIGVRNLIFYMPKTRDALIALLRERSRAAAGQSEAFDRVGCEVCGSPTVHSYGFMRFTGFVLIGTRAPDPRILCRGHAGRFVRGTVLRNAILGTIGLFGLQALVHAAQVLAFGEETRAITTGERWLLQIASIALPLVFAVSVVLLVKSQ